MRLAGWQAGRHAMNEQQTYGMSFKKALQTRTACNGSCHSAGTGRDGRSEHASVDVVAEGVRAKSTRPPLLRVVK